LAPRTLRATHFTLLCLSVSDRRYRSGHGTPRPSPFPQGSIEEVAKIVGDLDSGSELTRILDQTGLPDPLGSAMTKWKRLAAAMQENQASKQDGGAGVGLIHAAMAPDRTLSRRAEAAIARDDLNQVLSIAGYRVKDDGRIATATRATTDSEAAARSERLHKLLSDRGAHPDVLRYCRPELVRTDFYEAVFESIKGTRASAPHHERRNRRGRTKTGRSDLRGLRPVDPAEQSIQPIPARRAARRRTPHEGNVLGFP
jgi:hypothetical protein